jgi:hypothetical protein
MNGSAGRGGLITVTYDPAAKAYLEKVKVSAANGPKPVWVEGSVAALW